MKCASYALTCYRGVGAARPREPSPHQRGVDEVDGLLLEDELLLEDGLLLEDESLLEDGLLLEEGPLLEDGLLLEEELWLDCEPRGRELLFELLSAASLEELECVESDFCRCDGSRVLELLDDADAERFECFFSPLRRSFAVLEDELLFESAAVAADELDGALAALGFGAAEESDGGVFCATAAVARATAATPTING